MNAKTIALVIGIIFLAVGALGFFSNPIVGENAVFHTDAVHNAVHLVSGLLFVIVALAAPSSAKGFMKLFGLIYLLLGVIGFFQIGSDGMTKLLGFLHVNGADNYLHIGLGLVIFLAGVVTTYHSNSTRV